MAAGVSACDSASGDDRASTPSELVWSDEFDGANGALPDSSKWRLETFADATDDEKQCYTDDPDNVHTDGGGYLVIAAQEHAGNCADGWYRFVTSARLTTQGIDSWEYGRFEIRAKMPTGAGTWPAFWAKGDDPDLEWPAVGEIDAMEFAGADQTHVIGTVHGATDEGDRWFLQGETDTDEPLSADMHTYAVQWDSQEVTWWLDGEQYAKVTREEAEEQGNWAFDRKFYLILNLAIGGYIGGEVPEDLPYPQELVVDYVRVYQ